MANERRPSERITEEVASWPVSSPGQAAGVSSGSRWEAERSAICTATTSRTSAFPRMCGGRCSTEGRIDYHPVFPGRPGFGARTIESAADVDDVIALMRLNYERVVSRHGVPTEAAV